MSGGGTTAKTYEVTNKNMDFFCFVRAESASKARYRATNFDDTGYVDEEFPAGLVVIRRSEFDGENLTTGMLVTHGRMYDECPGCGKWLSQGTWESECSADCPDDCNHEHEAFAAPDLRGWCSEDCWREHGAPTDPKGAIAHGICLYADF